MSRVAIHMIYLLSISLMHSTFSLSSAPSSIARGPVAFSFFRALKTGVFVFHPFSSTFSLASRRDQKSILVSNGRLLGKSLKYTMIFAPPVICLWKIISQDSNRRKIVTIRHKSRSFLLPARRLVLTVRRFIFFCRSFFPGCRC